MKVFRRREKGFTLVEIMIVVMIIGILLAIAVPNFVRAKENSRAKGCCSNLKQIDGATQQWAIENKKARTDTPVQADIEMYLKAYPLCPSGGAYTIGTIAINPTCSIGTNGDTDTYNDHVL